MHRAVERATAMRDFITFEDGYVWYWPSGVGGFNAGELRALADELDRRNAEWNAIVQKEIGGCCANCSDGPSA